jgi:hypothetical protein
MSPSRPDTPASIDLRNHLLTETISKSNASPRKRRELATSKPEAPLPETQTKHVVRNREDPEGAYKKAEEQCQAAVEAAFLEKAERETIGETAESQEPRERKPEKAREREVVRRQQLVEPELMSSELSSAPAKENEISRVPLSQHSDSTPPSSPPPPTHSSRMLTSRKRTVSQSVRILAGPWHESSTTPFCRGNSHGFAQPNDGREQVQHTNANSTVEHKIWVKNGRKLVRPATPLLDEITSTNNRSQSLGRYRNAQ